MNPGTLPKGTTLADLDRKGIRRNALVADVLHRIDFVEKAGTGIRRIRDEAREGGYPEPIWEANGFVTTIFRPNPEVREAAAGGPRPGRDRAGTRPGTKLVYRYPASTPQVAAVLRACSSRGRSREELQAAAGIRDREHFRRAYLKVLIAHGLIELTMPDKPRSGKQRYRLTQTGADFLKSFAEKS